MFRFFFYQKKTLSTNAFRLIKKKYQKLTSYCDKKFPHKFEIRNRIFLKVHKTKLDFSNVTTASDKLNF